MTESASAPVVFSGRTAWARNLQTPLRQFLRTETGSAAVLLAATVAALAWVNVGRRVVPDGVGHPAVGHRQAATACPRTWASGSTPA